MSGQPIIQIDDDATLVSKVIAASKEYDAADATRKEKAIILGRLLAEAQKLHPSEKAFAAFLKRAGDIQIRRARDLIAMAVGRKTHEKHQANNAAAQQRHRDKRKAEKAEREKEKVAAAKKVEQDRKAKDDPALRNAANPTPKPPTTRPDHPDPTPDASKRSAEKLREFEFACRAHLPHLSEADLEKARRYMMSGSWRPTQGRAA